MTDGREAVRLVLEDGSSFEGIRLGAPGETTGEVVFNTSMTGYQEMLTDPSYGGQILVPTYPLIGNYGVNPADVESRRIQVRGFVVREDCENPSHPLSQGTIHEYLLENGVTGISGVDTRAITRRLRSSGVMMGIITPRPADEAIAALKAAPRYGEFDVVHDVSTRDTYHWDGDAGERSRAFGDLKGRAWRSREHWSHAEQGLSVNGLPAPDAGFALMAGTGQGDAGHCPADGSAARQLRIVVNDYGVKLNILRSLRARDCDVTVVRDDATAEEIMALDPDGVLLSPGPGDPVFLSAAVESAKKLVGKVPLMGICLGHQVVARAFGANTFKLHFGHRGGNQPVRDIETGKVYITAQNHGYAVDAEGLPPELEISHVNLNDGTVEGLRHTTLPVMTIQYHSEASPGPHDSEYLFDRFVEMVVKYSPSRPVPVGRSVD
ncbi:MAG: carbamoyl phosphate synthase small subunit [Chloroflexi bacterium]|nr:carbamoyl phosphate synthase small subunit [Chloroflexota bacterium]